MSKTICTECNWHGDSTDLLRAENPFDPGDTIHACPNCKTVDGTYQAACDEPDCWKEANCGVVTENGYKHVCGGHYQKIKVTGM
jgi:hypothetical protein